MDRFEGMATLIAAVDGGSLSAASRRLNMPLATVSRKVSDLEAHLNAKLLIRTNRRLQLTETGRAYVAACRRILDDIETAERVASGEFRLPTGHLTITAPLMFGRLHVQPIVLAFLKAFPDVTARLNLSDQVVSLIDDHVDVAIRIGALPSSSLVATRIGQIRWVTCASPDYLEDRGAPETPEDLASHDCILVSGSNAPSAWTYRRDGLPISLPINPRYTVTSTDAQIAAAVASAGVTRVLSYQVATAIADGSLRTILQPFQTDPVPVHMVHTADTLLPLKLRAFLDFAGPRLKASIPRLTE